MPERQQQREEKKQDTGAGGLEGREARGGSRQGAAKDGAGKGGSPDERTRGREGGTTYVERYTR